MRKEKKGIFASVYIVGLLAFLYIPILIMIAYSFNSSEISSIWGGFSTEWYKVLFSRHDVRNALLNTLEVSVPATVISIVLATVGVIGFYKYDFKGKKIIDSILYLPAVVPPLLLGIALLSLYNILGIKLGTMTIIIAHITFCTPFAFTTIKGAMDGFDRSLEEAARDLGCGEFETILKVIVPNIMPGIVSAALITFTISLDDVLTSFFVAGAGKNTLSMFIYSCLKKGVKPDINALSTILIVVSVALGVASQLIGRKEERDQ